MIWIFVILFVLATAYFVFWELHDKPLLALVLKAVASFSFILILLAGVTIYRNNLSSEFIGYFVFVFSGLVLGLIGDILLGLRPLLPEAKEDQIILSGTIAFLLGHLFYISAIVQMSKLYFTAIIFGAVFATIIYLISRWMKIKWRKLLVPCMTYTFILFLFVGQMIFSVDAINNHLFSIVMIVGSSLFALSDLVLSQIYFNHNRSKRFVLINLMMYYLAQALIAFAFVLLIM